jgi:hypothetical protein
MSLAAMKVQIRGVGRDEMNAYSDKWVGQRVRLLKTGSVHTIVHAQMLMGEQLKLDNGSWVTPWDIKVITE